MKYLAIILLIFLADLFPTSVHALPKYGVSTLVSPHKEYNISLFDASGSHDYELKLLRNGRELVKYPFEGELVSAYWSPSLKFVAVNNHYGHGGTHVWIISLANGSVITSHGVIRDPKYDRYTDYEYFSNLIVKAHSGLKRLYPEVDGDQLRNGYSSVAYGWSGDNQLLMFHEFGFDNLSSETSLIIQAFTTWHVTNRDVSLAAARFRKARGDRYEPMPSEVKKTLNFIP